MIRRLATLLAPGVIAAAIIYLMLLVAVTLIAGCKPATKPADKPSIIITTQAASPIPSPSPPIVRSGAFCSEAGKRGVTSDGTPMVCISTATDSRLRWRELRL